jgi:AcrR family transcriptional regulator
MARPRSDERRSAIMAATVRVIASDGLAAATATIAKEAGVSNGSLFTYFETKSNLLNALYIELKSEMAEAALDGLPTGNDVRRQIFHMWTNWLRWATSFPEKRRTLAYLEVSDEITLESRQTASHAMAGISELLNRGRANGPMRDAPKAFVVGLMSALADTTVDFMIRDPANAEKHSVTAFEGMWRMLG